MTLVYVNSSARTGGPRAAIDRRRRRLGGCRWRGRRPGRRRAARAERPAGSPERGCRRAAGGVVGWRARRGGRVDARAAVCRLARVRSQLAADRHGRGAGVRGAGRAMHAHGLWAAQSAIREWAAGHVAGAAVGVGADRRRARPAAAAAGRGSPAWSAAACWLRGRCRGSRCGGWESRPRRTTRRASPAGCWRICR